MSKKTIIEFLRGWQQDLTNHANNTEHGKEYALSQRSFCNVWEFIIEFIKESDDSNVDALLKKYPKLSTLVTNIRIYFEKTKFITSENDIQTVHHYKFNKDAHKNTWNALLGALPGDKFGW